jgi:hypothetical protein
MGVAVTAAAIANEAIIKKITGCENPLSAPAKSELTPNIGISPIVKREVIADGNASLISKIRKNNAIAIVFLPACVSPSGIGASSAKNKIEVAKPKPICWRLFMIKSCFYRLCRFFVLVLLFVVVVSILFYQTL